MSENPSTRALVLVTSVGLVIGVAVIVMLVIPGLQPELVASGNTVSTRTTTPAAGQIRVSIVPNSGSDPKLLGYAPDIITVAMGINNTIIWTNDDISPHTVTVANGFDSGNLKQGQVFAYTFTTPGTYEYVCTYHPWMHGTVIVKRA